jgi:hypothetical protein
MLSSTTKVRRNPMIGRSKSTVCGYDPSCKHRAMVVSESCCETVTAIRSRLKLPRMHILLMHCSEMGTFREVSNFRSSRITKYGVKVSVRCLEMKNPRLFISLLLLLKRQQMNPVMRYNKEDFNVFDVPTSTFELIVNFLCRRVHLLKEKRACY